MRVRVRTLRGAITPDCPASVLRVHDDVLMVWDKQAAWGLL